LIITFRTYVYVWRRIETDVQTQCAHSVDPAVCHDSVK